MNADITLRKDLYFTRDHEWIDFHGSVAYVGVCTFKLIGFKDVDTIIIDDSQEFRKQGDVIATVKYNDYQVEVHMPVDGKISKFNEFILAGDHNYLLKNADNGGWIALVVPLQPYNRKDLILPELYQKNSKRKNEK